MYYTAFIFMPRAGIEKRLLRSLKFSSEKFK
jgi:hypothetical protein